MAVNYNRDIEVFPVLDAIFHKISGTSPYRSPTDMGVNMAGNCICDDEVVCEASKDEIIRRYFATMCDRRKGRVSARSVEKLELLMQTAGVSVDDRPVVGAALKRRLSWRTGIIRKQWLFSFLTAGLLQEKPLLFSVLQLLFS